MSDTRINEVYQGDCMEIIPKNKTHFSALSFEDRDNYFDKVLQAEKMLILGCFSLDIKKPCESTYSNAITARKRYHYFVVSRLLENQTELCYNI